MIEMKQDTHSLSFRQSIAHILTAALRAVDPQQAVAAHVSLDRDLLCIGRKDGGQPRRVYRLAEIDRIFVVGAGKAGAPMSAALFSILGSRITAGVVNVRHGHTSAAGDWRVRFGGLGELPARPRRAETGAIAIVEAWHPTPDAAGQRGAERIVDLLTGLTPRDLVIVLISGGGSALLPLPIAGVTLADLQELTALLLRSGADITEINVVRKHCSQLQGGQLARRAAPAQVAALILSDVVGSPLDAIASGPTVPDRSTFADAVAVLERYGIRDQVPASLAAHLAGGAAGRFAETPKPGDPAFGRVINVVIGDNASAGRAAAAAARDLGFRSYWLTTFVQGEAREVGRVVAGLAQGIAHGQSDFAAPACLVLGGETTVTVRGHGAGGRNQELVLAAAIALDGYPLPPDVEVAVVSLGTDGADGPTDAAGGIAMPDTLARCRGLGLDPRAALTNNDSYPYLAALGDLIFTGPTNTNVNDLIFVVARRSPA